MNAYEGREGKDRAQGNLKRFVEGHIVGVCPWGEGEEAETLCGKKVRWVRERDRMVVSFALVLCLGDGVVLMLCLDRAWAY